MVNKRWGFISVECGSLGVVTENNSIIKVCFEKSIDEVNAKIEALYPDAQISSTLLLKKALQQLNEYFAGKRVIFNLPLNDSGLSSFARKIYQSLIKVPYGSIVTYGQLAAMADSPTAARATGRAMAANPFPIVVPCHRVVNSNGQPGFYSAANGAQTKEWLIVFEKQHSLTMTDMLLTE